MHNQQSNNNKQDEAKESKLVDFACWVANNTMRLQMRLHWKFFSSIPKDEENTAVSLKFSNTTLKLDTRNLVGHVALAMNYLQAFCNLHDVRLVHGNDSFKYELLIDNQKLEIVRLPLSLEKMLQLCGDRKPLEFGLYDYRFLDPANKGP